MLECQGKTDLIHELEAITEVNNPRLSTRHDLDLAVFYLLLLLLLFLACLVNLACRSQMRK